jgi:glycosyltransferase involved in cell wall biosynthesis
VKIVFVNRYFYPDHSATSQLLSDLAFHLAAGGRGVHVIASRQRYDEPDARLPAQETIRGVAVHRVWTTTFGRGSLPGRTLDYLTFHISAFVALLGTVSRGDIVVAKTDPPMLSVMAWPVARLKGARLVNWLQDIFPEIAAAVGMRWANGPAGRMLARLRDSTLRSAAINVVPGTSMKERVVALGMDAGRVRVIHNWADGDSIRPIAGNDNRLRKAWGYADRFVVMYSGNLGRANDFRTIVEAAERLRDDVGVAFLFVGAGYQLAPVQDHAARLRVQSIEFRPYQPHEVLGESLCVGNVHLISLRPELEGLMLPSKFYGIAAAGRPTIFVGNAGGEMAQLIGELRCGVVVPAGDTEGLTAAIRQLKSDPVLCRSYGENARLVFEQRFDKRHALEAWDEVLNPKTPDARRQMPDVNS